MKEDGSFRSTYCAPGYLSSGGKPCLVDTMSEEELHRIGFSKRVGFPGTIRCYIDRIRDESEEDVGVFHFYRDDVGDYVMSGIPLPHSKSIAFFNTKDISVANVMESIYDEHYIGIMKGNDMGTEFVTYDNGVNPDLLPDDAFEEVHRREVCRITYSSNLSGRRPNVMRARIPSTVPMQ